MKTCSPYIVASNKFSFSALDEEFLRGNFPGSWQIAKTLWLPAESYRSLIRKSDPAIPRRFHLLSPLSWKGVNEGAALLRRLTSNLNETKSSNNEVIHSCSLLLPTSHSMNIHNHLPKEENWSAHWARPVFLFLEETRNWESVHLRGRKRLSKDCWQTIRWPCLYQRERE